jgi:superfamily II DNA helicase RecQ
LVEIFLCDDGENCINYIVKMADFESFKKAVEDVKSLFSVSTLKQEQEEALFNFVSKRDVFVNLPTGFGKSLIYQMAPMVVKQLGLCINPIILVISPLVSLMQDQVNQLKKQGISAVSLSETSINDHRLNSGNYTIVYSSPESLLSNEVIRELIGSKVYKERVVGVVVDEAHCISHW